MRTKTKLSPDDQLVLATVKLEKARECLEAVYAALPPKLRNRATQVIYNVINAPPETEVSAEDVKRSSHAEAMSAMGLPADYEVPKASIEETSMDYFRTLAGD